MLECGSRVSRCEGVRMCVCVWVIASQHTYTHIYIHTNKHIQTHTRKPTHTQPTHAHPTHSCTPSLPHTHAHATGCPHQIYSLSLWCSDSHADIYMYSERTALLAWRGEVELCKQERAEEEAAVLAELARQAKMKPVLKDMSVLTHIHTHTHMSLHTHIRTHTRKDMSVLTHIHTLKEMSVHTHIHTHTPMSLHTHIHTHTRTSSSSTSALSRLLSFFFSLSHTHPYLLLPSQNEACFKGDVGPHICVYTYTYVHINIYLCISM